MKRVLFVALCMAILICLSSCGCDSARSGEADNKKSINAKSEADGGEGSFDVLYGTWKLDDHTSYFFNGKGEGRMLLSSDEYEFNYTLDEDILHIDFKEDTAVDSKYEFNIDNEKLTLISKDANKGTYEFSKAE